MSVRTSVKGSSLKGITSTNHGRFVFFHPHNVMYDRKVKGYGTIAFAKQMMKRRAKNKVARQSRKKNRG